MSAAVREAFGHAHPDVWLLDAQDVASMDRYLLARRLAEPADLPSRMERAGAGNMNLTLRVAFGSRSLILKQGRPWVEKYDAIAAPWERTIVEGWFYQAVSSVPAVSSRMPALVDLDEHNHILALEDLGSAGDYTDLYADRGFGDADLDDLLEWLAMLHQVPRAVTADKDFSNRGMRQLNHEHIFRLPMAADNGLDLDAITEGLAALAHELKQDRAYGARVTDLGRLYLSDGDALIHGDYFPGSWVRTPAGVRVIDPEFCCLGAREFDYGVMLAHLAMAGTGVSPAVRVLNQARVQGLDLPVVLGFAGTEIMRRLIGVAQLPLTAGVDAKRRLLDVSRSLVLEPEKGLACWG